jgi:hypothetical protein
LPLKAAFRSGTRPDQASCSSLVLLLDTSWWWDDGREDPVVNGVLSDPNSHQSKWHAVTGNVSKSVFGGLVGEFPESRQVHFYFSFNIYRWILTYLIYDQSAFLINLLSY